jgi:hypothetical protein
LIKQIHSWITKNANIPFHRIVCDPFKVTEVDLENAITRINKIVREFISKFRTR